MYLCIIIGRIDHLTGAILFWNEKKFREMARLILKQFQTVTCYFFIIKYSKKKYLLLFLLIQAKVRVTQYQSQLQNLLNKRNEDLEKLIVSLKGVIDQVSDTMLISFILHFSALQKCNLTGFFSKGSNQSG